MNFPYKSLFKIALISSPVIVMLGIFPMYFQGRSSVQELGFMLIFMTVHMLVIWGMNIGLINLFEKFPKRYLRYFVSIILAITIAYVISKIIDVSKYIKPPVYHGSKPLPPMRNSFPFFSTLFNDFFVLFIIDMVIFRNREKFVENENAELRIKNLEAQQIQLRQQIQPHFLFNSLNTLKSLISDHPDLAEEYLVRLSSFLRYNLSSNNQDLILLKDELKICSDYLGIQKVRFKDALKFSIKIENEDDVLNSRIPIFAIQLLIENAIKHNFLTIEYPLNIEITLTKNNTIKVFNNLHEKLNPDNSMGIGLKNLSERYKLLIKKDIQINKTEDNFIVFLPLA